MSLSSTPPDQSALTQRGPVPRTNEFPEHSATRRGVFFIATAILYTGFILLAVLAANPYFAQTWDVITFLQAGHRFLDGGNPFDLYAQTRASQTWPYAYPPLHALVVAAGLVAGKTLPWLPDFFWARLPALLADIGIGMAVYVRIEQKTANRSLAQTGFLLWLFNPVTFYDTAIQGHFESEWLLFVLLAYAWFERASGLDQLLSSLALAIAVLFKQTAILFAIPLWAFLAAKNGPANPLRNRLRRLVLSGLVFGVVVGMVCLPYLLYSSDFLFMNLTYVENVPVQTQSWIVALLGLTRSSANAMATDFFLFRYQMPLTLLAAAAIAFWAGRSGRNLYLTACLVAVVFFLTSKKVMGYYYVMLIPFLLIECLPRRRWDLVLIMIAAMTWISLSPYYAAWGNPEHWGIYALLGSLNSLLFVWLAIRLVGSDVNRAGDDSGPTVLITLGLFAGAVSAVLVQPLVGAAGSPIRAPIITPGAEGNAVLAFGLMMVLWLGGLALLTQQTRGFPGKAGKATWGLVLIFAPLFFAVYTLTKESTAILEIALKTLGG